MKQPREFVTKCCKKCGAQKNTQDFYAEKRNRDGLRSVCKKCLKASVNKESQSANAKQWYVKNRDLVIQKTAEWKTQNKQKWQLQHNLRSRIGKFITRLGFVKPCTTSEIIGCSYLDARVHIEKQFLSGMNWENYGDWHIDHIVPLSQAKDLDGLLRLCHFTNLRPLWAKENLSKSNKSLYLI